MHWVLTQILEPENTRKKFKELKTATIHSTIPISPSSCLDGNGEIKTKNQTKIICISAVGSKNETFIFS